MNRYTMYRYKNTQPYKLGYKYKSIIIIHTQTSLIIFGGKLLYLQLYLYTYPYLIFIRW